ncbi:branched-chain amino acid ABC transporter permease [Spirillospora sp. CA-255316]
MGTTETRLAPATADGLGDRRSRYGRVVRAVAEFGVPALLVLGYLGPSVIVNPFDQQVLMIAFLNAAVVAPLVLSLGYAGLLNLSQGTFYGLGAYTTAILVTDHRWTFEAALVAAALVAGLAGGMLSLASARVKGDYFVLISLGLTIAVAQLLANLPDLTRGREGYFGIPSLDLFGISFDEPVNGYYLVLTLLIVVYLFVHRIGSGFLGRSMLVVRYDDVAARSMGINPLKARATAMVLSSALGGVAGGFLVATVQFISPGDFDFDASFLLSLYVIIGGMASLPGAVIVAMLFTILEEQFRDLSDYSVGMVGIAVLIAVFFRGGVVRDLLLARSASRGMSAAGRGPEAK